MREVILAVQHADGGGSTWTKSTSGHVSRSGGSDELAASGTADAMIVVGGDGGMHNGNIPHIVSERQADWTALGV